MNQAQFELMHQSFDQVRLDLSQLEQQATEIRTSVESGCFVPDETAGKMKTTLEQYQHHYSQLRKLAEELLIPMTERQADIESAIEVVRKQVSLEQVRELVWTYFRLTASLEKIRTELEASKKRLVELCREAEHGRQEGFAPYRLVVQKLGEDDSYLSEDEYDLVEQTIGRQTARGLDRRDQSGLRVDPDLDITSYLDGSCMLLGGSDEAPATKVNDQEAQHIEDTAFIQHEKAEHIRSETEIVADSCVPEHEKSEASQMSTTTDTGSENSKLTPATFVDGRVQTDEPLTQENTSYSSKEAERLFSLGADVPAGQLGAKNFLKLQKQRPDTFAALWYFGNAKLLEKEALEAQNGVAGLFQWGTVNQMLKKGYLTEVGYHRAGTMRVFLTLTSMGWACFHKADIVKQLRKGKTTYVVPAQMQLRFADLTEQNLNRLVLLHDFFRTGEKKSDYFVYPYGSRRLITGDSFSDEEVPCHVTAAVLQQESSKPDVVAIQSFLDEMDEKDSLTIIVTDVIELGEIAQQLIIPQGKMVLYCLENAYDTLLDGTGTPVDGSQGEHVKSRHAAENNGDIVSAEEKQVSDSVRVSPVSISEDVQIVSEQDNSLPQMSILDEINNDSDDTEERPHNNAAEDAENVTKRDPAQEELYRQKGLGLLLRGQYSHALALFRALGRYSESNQKEYQRLAYALDDPATKKHYKYTELLQIFDNEEDTNTDALMLSAYLRVFFSDDARTELYHLQNCVKAVENNHMYLVSPQLKELVYELGKLYQDIERGFDPGTVDLLLNAEGRESEIEKYRSEAIALLGSRLEEVAIPHNRVKATGQMLFGRNSLLHRMLSCVSAGSIKDANSVAATLKDYTEEGFVPGNIYSQDDLSDLAIKRLIDSAWTECSGRAVHQRNDDLKGNGRTVFTSRVRSVLSACLSWASLTLDSAASRLGDQESRLRDGQKKTVALLEKILNETDEWNGETNAESAYWEVLRHTIEEMLGWLQHNGRVERDSFYYISFLKGYYIEVGEDYLPELELELMETTPYSVCKRIIEDSEKDDLPWQDVLLRIFTNPEKGRDYGHALLIRDFLRKTEPDYQWPERYDINENIASSKALLNSKDSDFAARLEMAENYGWIENPAVIERINANMELRRQHYIENHNYGFYFRTMGACLRQLERDAEQLREPKERRLEALHRKADEDYPIFAEIQRLIDQHMYTVAQDYMDQVEKDGIRELPESTSLTDENHTLNEFISQYGKYYDYAKKATNDKLVKVYAPRHRGQENRNVKSGIAMLENWPRSEGGAEVTSGKLRNLFEGIGLKVQSVRMETSWHFLIRFKPEELTADYPHPIGVFGSEMQKNGLHVFLLFGMKDANALNAAIRERITASLTGASIILADTQIQLSEKRKLAQTIKQENQNTQPYVILDRVTLLWLADQPQPERWNLFLKCSLPFHYLNPFTENSTMVICPDMFIGRRKELEQVVSAGGANIIYGGRQLGKTALLHFANSLENHRDKGKWSVFLDIKPDNAQRTAQRIYEKLVDEGFFHEVKGEITWDVLSRLITRRINQEKPEVNRLLLLLDEADRFLADCQVLDYEPVVHLRRIQAETQNRFKFVLAGLHNVLRFSEQALDGNSALPQLGSITIRPLSFKEASELLERPLSYLGFQLKRENMSLIAQILSSTNYYPGLIQFYASRLVRSVCQNNYGDVNEKPPYWLREDQILTLLKDQEFLENIKNKFMITLGIDQHEKGYYKTLAYVLADCYYQFPEGALEGYTVRQIQSLCDGYDIHSISILKPEQVKVLLDELIVLNILRKSELHGDECYIFNRSSFRHMLGDKQEIEDKLLEMMEREQQGYEN